MNSPGEKPPTAGGTVLVAGIGNIFLGDDGFGSEAAQQLSRRLQLDTASPAARWWDEAVRVVDYGIRGMHLAYDLLDDCADAGRREPRRVLVILDALPLDAEPGEVAVLRVGAEDVAEAGGLDAHGMDPASVLANLTALGGEVPPTYVVGCRPRDLEEGIGLSEPVAAAVPVAVDRTLELVAELGLRPAEAGRS